MQLQHAKANWTNGRLPENYDSVRGLRSQLVEFSSSLDCWRRITADGVTYIFYTFIACGWNVEHVIDDVIHFDLRTIKKLR
jgi:hypothetical protein